MFVQSEGPGGSWPELADEFMHPHTQWMLQQPLAKFVLDPQPVYLKHSRPTASGGAAAASAVASGSPSGPSADASGQGTNMEADTASQRDPSPDTYTPTLLPSSSVATADHSQFQQPHFASRAQQLDAEQAPTAELSRGAQAVNEQSTPALSAFSASHTVDTPTGSEPYTPAGSFVVQFTSCPDVHASKSCKLLSIGDSLMESAPICTSNQVYAYCWTPVAIPRACGLYAGICKCSQCSASQSYVLQMHSKTLCIPFPFPTILQNMSTCITPACLASGNRYP